MELFQDFTRVAFRGVSAALPPNWEQAPGPEGSWIIAHPPVPEGRFRPNLILRSGKNGGVPLMRIAASGLAATIRELAPIHVLSVDEWPKVFDTERGQSLPGRRHRFVYTAEGHTVCVDRWLWVIGGGVLEATASYALEDHTALKPLFEYLVDQLTVVDHGSTYELQLANIGLVSGEEPFPDAYASQQRNTPVEDLMPIAAGQQYSEAGILLTGAAGDLFHSLSGRGGLGRFELSGSGREAAELVAAGLVTEQGKLTEMGEAFLAPCGNSVGRLRAEAHRNGAESVAEVWIGEDLALISASPSFYGSSLPGEGRRELRLLKSTDAALVLASWAGIGPAWTMQHDPLVIDVATFNARVAGVEVPVPSSTEAVTRLWQAPWTEWSITHLEANAGFRWLHAGEAGHYSVIPADGGIRLDAQPSSLVWDAVVRVVHTALTGTELDLSTDVPSAWLHARDDAGTSG